MSPSGESVIWHDLECGGYRQDLGLWRRLAADAAGPILDVGAGTGRVSLALVGDGHTVTAVDSDAELLGALRNRADALGAEPSRRLSTVCGDARELALGDARFGLVVVAMQTIQLFGGAARRRAFLACAREHLGDGATVAVSLAEEFEAFEWADGDAIPLPDIVELDGTVYASQPTAVRPEAESVALERRREVIDAAGGRRVSEDRITLDRCDTAELIADAVRSGLRPRGTHEVAATDEHVGSRVVILGA